MRTGLVEIPGTQCTGYVYYRTVRHWRGTANGGYDSDGGTIPVGVLTGGGRLESAAGRGWSFLSGICWEVAIQDFGCCTLDLGSRVLDLLAMI